MARHVLSRKPYPTEFSDEGWAFVPPYLSLITDEAPQPRHDLREVFNALSWIAAGCFEALGHDLRTMLRRSTARADGPTAVILDGATRQSTTERGHRAGYDGHKKRNGSKIHAAVDTLGELLILHVTPANAGDRIQVAALRRRSRRSPDKGWSWASSIRATAA
jgi:transposase